VYIYGAVGIAGSDGVVALAVLWMGKKVGVKDGGRDSVG